MVGHIREAAEIRFGRRIERGQGEGQEGREKEKGRTRS